MASAGRILILPKGNWSAETEYEMLDLVFNAGASWVARKRVVGVEPTEVNEEYWMKMCEGANLVEVYQRLSAIEEQLISTISLDDIDLSPYALKTDLSSYATRSELSGYAAKSELSSYASKTDVNTINSNITSLDSRLDVAEPKITSLTSDVSNLNGKASSLESSIWTLQNALNGMSGGGLKIESGSYVGSNNNGESNKSSLTFSFAPKIVILSTGTFYNGVCVWHYNAPILQLYPVGGGQSQQIFFELNGNTLKWWANNGPQYQLNSGSMTYHWVAIG